MRNYREVIAGEKLYIGDFVKIVEEKAFRGSHEDAQMSCSNYEISETAIIINENTIFNIQKE
jgi:hypothetical protein